jgi:dienelactone hydrolase
MWSGNYVPWSLVDFDNKLFAGVQSLGGVRVLYTETGSPDDGSWLYSVGGDSGVPNGFDDKKIMGIAFLVMHQNIAANLYAFGNELYAGLVTNYSPKLGVTQDMLNGAQLWKTGDGVAWHPVTINGFGDSHNVSFDCLAASNGTIYIGATKASGDGPEGLTPPEGAKLYKLVSKPHTPAPLFEQTDTYEETMPQNGDAADIYYPLTDNRTDASPVALLLQGARVDKSYYSQYARQVARYGFIVVVPNHINMFSVPGFSEEGLFAEQQQLYDVLEFMASENTRTTSPVYGKVDTEILVMLGHSYGAACTLGAIQNTCEYPFCPQGEAYTRPPQLKAAALCGINTKPFGNPFDQNIRATHNQGMPLAIINGSLDGNATPEVTKISYCLIDDPPKALVFINGANHFAMCDINNPPGPSPQKNDPSLSQEVSIETAGRWSALFLRAHALNDEEAFDYIYTSGKYLDQNVEIFSTSEE